MRYLKGSVMAAAIVLATMLTAAAQGRYTVDRGEISFTSNAELELIRASSPKVQGLIDPLTRQFAFSVDVESFRGFNSELQREHFQEKYMEAELYPKARFSGKIIEEIDFASDATYEVRAKGELDIHGQKQTRIIRGTVTTKDGILNVTARFTVPLTDHNITVPSIVRQKIATEIEVVFTAAMLLK